MSTPHVVDLRIDDSIMSIRSSQLQSDYLSNELTSYLYSNRSDVRVDTAKQVV